MDARTPRRPVAADAWRTWEHGYGADAAHTVTARAVESDGTVQPREERSPFPRGATGWASVRVTP